MESLSPGQPVYLGIDFGTSGARASVVDAEGAQLAAARSVYENVDADGWAVAWERALFSLLSQLPADLKSRVCRVAFDGTSGTVLLVDRATGDVLQPAKLYNEKQPESSVRAVKEIAPPGHMTATASSALARLLTWHVDGAWQAAQVEGRQPCLLHQADWLLSLLTGVRGATDWNNALKLGFDASALAFPGWMGDRPWSHLLPGAVHPPGAVVARILPEMSARTGLAASCEVVAGTTDSIAAFLAAGVSKVGEAVTSLGSTMAVKMLSEQPVYDARFGIYSHRLPMGWLVGGASNAGGAALRQLFTDAQLAELTAQMDVDRPTGLDYYPIPATGETFPVYDPELAPRLEPRPDSDVVFLQGVFESLARIEGRGYALLQELGASPVQLVYTAGGGAKNAVWTKLRERAIGVPVLPSPNGEASYGAALLARSGCTSISTAV